MTTQKPDSPDPVTPSDSVTLSEAKGPMPAADTGPFAPLRVTRSEALEAELAMLEAILPAEAKGSDSPTDREGAR